MLDSAEYITIISFDRCTILSQVGHQIGQTCWLQCHLIIVAAVDNILVFRMILYCTLYILTLICNSILFYFVSNFVFLISQICLDCSQLFFEKMMCQVNVIIEIVTYTSELKSKPLMPWLIGSAIPEFTSKFNVLKEQQNNVEIFSKFC